MLLVSVLKDLTVRKNTSSHSFLKAYSPTFSSSIMDTSVKVDLPQAKFKAKAKKSEKVFESLTTNKGRKVIP